MAYVFNTQHTATFEVPVSGAAATSKTLKLSGINATETSANSICNGISSLLAIGGITAELANGVRTVKENVDISN